ERCKVEVPPLIEVAPGHKVACHFPISVAEVAAGARAGQLEAPAADEEVAAPVVEPHFVEPGPPHA
ncbi:MAG: ABC transporter ATP-binding protein, partial [Chloroflexi bacterium]|nr:ABC transporter ATP-binding protein [Chloroflexota bacterium]